MREPVHLDYGRPAAEVLHELPRVRRSRKGRASAQTIQIHLVAKVLIPHRQADALFETNRLVAVASVTGIVDIFGAELKKQSGIVP